MNVDVEHRLTRGTTNVYANFETVNASEPEQLEIPLLVIDSELVLVVGSGAHQPLV